MRVAGVRMEKAAVPSTWMMSVAASLSGNVAGLRKTNMMVAIANATNHA